MSFNCKNFVVVGSKVFVLLPMSLCEGDPNLSEMGYFDIPAEQGMGPVCLEWLFYQVLRCLNGFLCHAIRLQVMWTCCLVLESIIL